MSENANKVQCKVQYKEIRNPVCLPTLNVQRIVTILKDLSCDFSGTVNGGNNITANEKVHLAYLLGFLIKLITHTAIQGDKRYVKKFYDG